MQLANHRLLTPKTFLLYYSIERECDSIPERVESEDGVSSVSDSIWMDYPK